MSVVVWVRGPPRRSLTRPADRLERTRARSDPWNTHGGGSKRFHIGERTRIRLRGDPRDCPPGASSSTIRDSRASVSTCTFAPRPLLAGEGYSSCFQHLGGQTALRKLPRHREATLPRRGFLIAWLSHSSGEPESPFRAFRLKVASTACQRFSESASNFSAQRTSPRWPILRERD